MNTPRIYCIACFVFLCINAYAQPVWQWGRTGTNVEEAWAIATDNMGNVFAAGINNSSTSSIFGSATVPATAAAVQSVWVKYNSSGVALWAGGTFGGVSKIINITTDPSGNLFVYGFMLDYTLTIGTFTLSSSTAQNYFLAKVSPTGTVLWALNDGTVYSLSSIPLIEIKTLGNVSTDDSGNVYITGQYRESSMTIGTYSLINADVTGLTTDIFIAKYTPSGVLSWATSAGGVGYDYAVGSTVSSTGDLYITGDFASPSVSFGPSVLTNSYTMPRSYIAKYSPAGIPVWAQSAGGSNGSSGIGLAHDNSGNIYMAGSYFDTSISFGGTTITRYAPSPTPAPASFLVKYSSTGVATWGRTISAIGINDAITYSVSLSSCGKVWISGGSTNGTLVIGPGDSLTTLSHSGDPMFIAGYDFSGDVIGYSGLASGGDDQNAIACDAVGNVYLCGDFEGDTLTVGSDALTSYIGEQLYVARFGPTPDTIPVTGEPINHCGADSTTLTAPAGAGYYFWDDSETSPTRTVYAPGNYWVFATTCGATVEVDSFHVTFNPLPGIITGSNIICIGESSTFADTVAGGTWLTSNSAVATINPVTGNAVGMSVGLCVISYVASTGCLVTKSVTIDAAPCTNNAPAASKNTQPFILPNPATDYLTVQTTPGTYASCTLINNLGQVVITQPIVAAQTRVDVSMLPAGVYYLRMSGEGDAMVDKIVISH